MMTTELENNIYIADFICTYKMFDDDYEESLILYQIQLLQAFDLKSYDINIINKVIEDLYEKYKENSYISKFIINAKIYNKDVILDNGLMVFTLGFQYDTFYLFHTLLCSLINKTPVNEDKYNELIQITSKEKS